MSVESLPDTSAPAQRPDHRPAALSCRRWLLVLSPVLAVLLLGVGILLDPGVGQDGRPMFEAYAAEPDAISVAAIAFHWGFAFWMLPALLVAASIRGRGAWLANIGAFLAFVGISTLPGLLVVDFYDSAIGQVLGVDATVAVAEKLDTMWGMSAFAAPGMLGFVLALPLSAIALWRSGRASWWAPLVVIAGFVVLDMSSIARTTITLALLTAYSVALHRATREQ